MSSLLRVNMTAGEYHIYAIKGDKVRLLGSGPSPKELEDKYVKIDKLFG